MFLIGHVLGTGPKKAPQGASIKYDVRSQPCPAWRSPPSIPHNISAFISRPTPLVLPNPAGFGMVSPIFLPNADGRKGPFRAHSIIDLGHAEKIRSGSRRALGQIPHQLGDIPLSAAGYPL